MCHFKKTLQAQLRRLIKERGADQPDTPAMALYRKILSKAMIVDRFHFKNHKGATGEDAYCAKETNPTLDRIPVGLDSKEFVDLQELIEGENSESSEQLFRWMGRLKQMANKMALSRATFFYHRMVWLKNERTIIEHCMESMKREEVACVRAAYGLPAVGSIGAADRAELAVQLLKGTREYDLEGPMYTAYLVRT